MKRNEREYDAKTYFKIVKKKVERKNWFSFILILGATNKIPTDSNDYRFIASLKMDKNLFKVCFISFPSH